MNLHEIVAGPIGAVNQFIPGTIQISAGYVTNADGSRTSNYTTVTGLLMQVQPMTYRDLQQVEGLNLNGSRRAIYIRGRLDGIVRVSQKGGDLITLTSGPNAGVWLTAMVLEQWPGWVKVAVTLQDGT